MLAMRYRGSRGLVVLTFAILAWASLGAHAHAQRRRRDRDREPQAPGGGTLVIQSSQDGAEVFVDEQPVGTTPLEPLSLAPGSHTLRVRLPGYTEHTDVVRIDPGQRTEVPVDLLPLSQVLSVVTDPPGAHVYVDGTFMGETPVEFDMLEGQHSVRVVLRDYEEAIRQVEARAGSRDELAIELTPLPEDQRVGAVHETQWYEEPVTWIAVGGGAAAVAITIAIVVVATSSSASQVDEFCAPGCIRHQVPW